jgi:hypothetical protein
LVDTSNIPTPLRNIKHFHKSWHQARDPENPPPPRRRPPLSDGEYNRLSAVPFSEMTRAESLALCAEARRRMAGTRFRYDPREFRGRRYWERGFLSCAIAGAQIPSRITLDLFKVPRNRVIFQALRELERLNLAGLGALTVFLWETGRIEAAGGEKYLLDVEGMIGVSSAIRGFALGLLRIGLGARI